MNIKDIISREGIKNIKVVEKRLNRLLEITQCVKCKVKKPLNEFSEDKDGHLGYSNICKLCSGKSEHEQACYKCKKCEEYKSINNFYLVKGERHIEYCIECIKHMINENASGGLLKQCYTCGENKPATTQYYYVSLTSKGMLKRNCISCENLAKIKKN